jgi:hypothetical protein
MEVLMRLPAWMLMLFVVVSFLLLFIGWEDRHEAGPLPFILGIAWSLFTLASFGASRPRPER